MNDLDRLDIVNYVNQHVLPLTENTSRVFETDLETLNRVVEELNKQHPSVGVEIVPADKGSRHTLNFTK